MKKIILFILACITALSFSSCLKSDLDELDTYTEHQITSIVGVYHRYYAEDSIPVAQDRRVLQTSLKVSDVQINKDTGTVTFKVSDPSNLPASQQGKVSASNMVVIVGISTAAVITPVGDSPALGTPGNWSKPNTYIVKAADGTTQTWNMTLTYE